MTSYNPINGFWSASSYDLLTTILHGQWGYKGMVMTDWWAKSNDQGQEGERTNTAAMVRAQNDLYMVVPDSESNALHDNSAEGLSKGTVDRAEFIRSAANICNFLLQSPAMLRMRGIESELDKALSEAPSLDDGDSAEMFYVQTGEDNALDFDASLIGMSKGDNTRFGVSIKEQGLYKLILTLRSTDQNDVSQLPLSVFQDRNLLGTATLTGAQRDWETVEFNVMGFSGNFYLRFFAAQTGLELKGVRLEIVKTMEELQKEFGQ